MNAVLLLLLDVFNSTDRSLQGHTLTPVAGSACGQRGQECKTNSAVLHKYRLSVHTRVLQPVVPTCNTLVLLSEKKQDKSNQN